jgi:hypothetical protein
MELLKGLPQTPSGRVDMVVHYSAYRGTADYIAGQIIIESDQQRTDGNPVLA